MSELEKTSSSSSSAAVAKPKDSSRTENKSRELPPYNVVLLDDDEHSQEYVIEMLQTVFGYPPEQGFVLTREVDETGRAIVLTTHREKAELKRDQILGFGTDPRVAICTGSMSAVIEPAIVE